MFGPFFSRFAKLDTQKMFLPIPMRFETVFAVHDPSYFPPALSFFPADLFFSIRIQVFLFPNRPIECDRKTMVDKLRRRLEFELRKADLQERKKEREDNRKDHALQIQFQIAWVCF